MAFAASGVAHHTDVIRHRSPQAGNRGSAVGTVIGARAGNELQVDARRPPPVAVEIADVLGGARGESDRLEQRVGGQPIGTVQAGGCNLADGPQARHAGAPEGVGGNAAHVVMRGGRNWDELRDGVDAGGAAVAVDGWKCGCEPRADGLAAIEEGAAAGGDLGEHRARHDIAWAELGAPMLHERSPLALTSAAPSPRKASVASGAGSVPTSRAVGWNCTNSRRR
jgi:hypothetical protein